MAAPSGPVAAHHAALHPPPGIVVPAAPSFAQPGGGAADSETIGLRVGTGASGGAAFGGPLPQDSPVPGSVGALELGSPAVGSAASAAAAPAAAAAKPGEDDLGPINAPQLGAWPIFVMFWGLGCRAFGGPMAQIAMMKARFIAEEKWVTVKRFNRVMSVYQAL